MSKRNSVSTAKIIKLFSLLFVSAALTLSSSACRRSAKDTVLTLATTTSVDESGLLEQLKQAFEKDMGIKLKIVAQGTGQAIKTAEKGDADILLVHDKNSEEKFVAEGFGLKRIELMHNYFVIVGPCRDPADIKSSSGNNAAKALSLIMDKEAAFISRGDDSGTHKKELALWETAGLNPSGGWYFSAGRGMGEVLSMASEKQAYTLTDKATFLSMKDKLELEIVLENSADLKNQYTVIAVNPAKHKTVNKEAAESFVRWVTSEKALKIIGEYGRDKYGEALFEVNCSKNIS
ncbi:MAG: substrate-binding domain-containing protein [Clostridia bacterium]|nr:substrate-binding domain-containing protein [Clostridia bacterium]